jgi:hypothetical protein
MRKMATTYFATSISEHLARTPERYLLARGCTLGRTGFQRYQVRDLPQERAAELNVDLSDGNAYIDLYRPPEEVFAPATIASAEGKDICLSHPPGFVDPDNFRQYSCGHVQNVHKGSEPLESGEMPLVGDLLIKDAQLIAAVEGGLRSLSLGYDYFLQREGDKLLQTNIVINHCAVVDKGRAGPEARINDAAIDAPAPEASPDYAELQKAVDAKRGRDIGREQTDKTSLGDFDEMVEETRVRGERELGGQRLRDVFKRDRNIHHSVTDHEVDRLLALEHMYAAARGRRGN